MFKRYVQPVLLIETDKPDDMPMLSDKGLIRKMALATLAFPGLRVLWSRGASHTAALFLELKRTMPEPEVPVDDGLVIVDAMPQEDGTEYDEASSLAMMTLLHFPGVSAHNVTALVAKYTTLHEVATASERELSEAGLGPAVAQGLYKTLHALSC